MSELLDMARGWIEQIILALGYPGIALVMLAENLFPPIPSELVMPFAGFLAARGELNFVGVLAAGVVGSVLGAIVLYGIGAWAGERVARPFVQRFGQWFLLSDEDLDRAMQVFARYGTVAVLVGRVMPIVRSLISIPAGMNHMDWRPFLLFTTIGTTVWNLLLGGAGWWLGSRWDEILTFTKRYERGVLVVLGAMVFGYVVFRVSHASAPSNLR
jgi:membrane protein DedA with SNARE-associated domain